jgi:carbonic anhydrase/acetyltransferase-like protein (isoleucine patch superfamily)
MKAKTCILKTGILFFFAAVNCLALADNVTIEVDPSSRLSNATVIGEWATEGNLDSWTGGNMSGPTSTGGYITGTGTAAAPYIQRTVMSAPDLDFGYNDYLQIKIMVPASFNDDIIFQFGTSTHTGFASTREFRIPDANIVKDGNWHTYRLDLGLVVWWRDTFRDMKIQPLGNSGNGQTFYIDYVEVGDIPGDVLSVNTNLNFASGENLASCSKIESKHAVFWYSPTSYTVDGTTFVPATMGRRALRMIEESYQVYCKKLGYKEPFVSYTGSPTTRYKVNHTTWWSGYWMGGMGNYGYLNVPRSGLGDEGWGSPVPHEFGHVVQSHQPGYLAGSHWESHANFLRDARTGHYAQLFTSHPSELGTISFEFGNYRQDHKRLIYSDFRIHYALKDFAGAMGLDPALVGKFWTQTPKDMTVYAKLAQMLPTGFDIKDVVAFCVRHWPFLDFGTDGTNFKTTLWNTTNNKAWWYYITGSLLTPSQDNPGWWRVPFARAPEKFAFMYHELNATDTTVTVEFHGFDVIGNAEDWRWSLAAMDGSGNVRFSDLWTPGTQSFDLNTGETKVYLIVVATPSDTSLDLDTYYNLKPNDKHIDRLRYPYQVRIEGATPANRQLAWSKNASGHYHSNGGGWVDNSATVSSTAYVGPNARVLGNAKVYNYAQIEDYAVVAGSATVQNYATVSGYASVFGSAKVQGNAKVRDRAIVEGTATVEDNAVIEDYAHLIETTHVYESAICRGNAYPWGSSAIAGTAIADYDYSYGWAMTDGTHFGHFPWGDYFHNYFDSTQKKPRGLVASYRVEESEGDILWDEFGAQHAILRGSPQRPVDGQMDSKVLRLDGSSQYVVLDRALCDSIEGSFGLWCKPSATDTNLPLLFMGSSATKYLKLIARDGSGKAVFTITNGSATNTLVSTSAIPIGSWTHLALTFNGSQTILYVNGIAETVVSTAPGPDSVDTISTADVSITDSTILVPDDVLGSNDYTSPEAFYIGRDWDGNLFAGDIEDARFYNVELTSTEVTSEVIRKGNIIGAFYFDAEKDFDGSTTTAESGVHNGLERVLDVWVYPDTSDNVSYYEGILDSTDSNYSSYKGSGLGLDNKQILVRMDSKGFWNTGIYVTTGTWQHITAMFNGKMAFLFVDDQLKATTTYSATETQVAGKNYRIGFAQDTSYVNYYYDGKIKQATIGDKLPAGGLTGQDIGTVSAAGVHIFYADNYYLEGSGAGITGTADEFYYAWQSLHGNGQATVYLASQQNTNTQAMAGIMIREALTSSSKHAVTAVTPGSGAIFQYRTNTGGSSTQLTSSPTISAPCWLKLVRCGDTFTGYASTDSVTWTSIGSTTISMADDVYIGLCDTSRSDGTRSLAAFQQLVISDTLPPDINMDGNVDAADLALFVSQWLNSNCCQTDWCQKADLDMNGSVDFYDFATFADSWMIP